MATLVELQLVEGLYSTLGSTPMMGELFTDLPIGEVLLRVIVKDAGISDQIEGLCNDL